MTIGAAASKKAKYSSPVKLRIHRDSASDVSGPVAMITGPSAGGSVTSSRITSISG